MKTSDISLTVFGNDASFIKNLSLDRIIHQNTYYPKAKKRGEDLCFGINYCDSMVLTASGSTFGWWMSYLMKPEANVFYNSQITDFSNHSKDVYDYDLFPKHWHMLTIANGKATMPTITPAVAS